MAIFRALALSAALWAAGGVVAAAPSTESNQLFDLPYEMRTLDNGLRVIVVPTAYPDVVSIQIPVQAGSRNEIEPGKSGFAHFFEHLMFRGTENYTPEEYGLILKQAGADENAYTTDDYTNYHVTFTKADLETMIRLQADRFQNLSYSEADFRTEALAVKGEYLKNFSNPIRRIIQRIRSLAFETHPYRHTTMGFIEDIEDMPNEFEYSHTFFDRWYGPEYTSLIVVGDVEPGRVFGLVEEYWGGWERSGYEVTIPDPKPLDGPIYDHIQWEAPTQPWIVFAFRGPAFNPDSKALSAIQIAGELYFGQTSDLYRELVVEKQWVDQLFAYIPDRVDSQLLYIGARLNDPAAAEAVQKRLAETLAQARTTLVDSRRLENLKSNLKYTFAAQLDSTASIASMLASFVHFNRTPETLNAAYRTFDQVNAEDIRHYAREFFVDSGQVLLTLSNGEALAGVDPSLSVDKLAAAQAQAKTADVAVVELPGESSLVDVMFLFNTGAAQDPEGKKGLAALTAMMIANAGSEAMSYSEITEALYPLAAGFSAQVDKEMIRLSGSVHQDNLNAWYGIVSGMLLHPGWREEDFTRVKTQLINAIQTGLRSSNDEELGKEVLYAEIYGPEHPYGSYNLGAVSDLKAITLDDVKNFYRTHFTQGNLTVGLAGGYSDEFKQRLLQDLAILPEGATPIELPPVRDIQGRHAVIVQKETPAVAVSFGFPIRVERGDPDWVALWLVRSWLGEHRSSNSYLYQRIREARGMNYGDYAYIEYFPRGMFLNHPDTNLGRQQQIFQIWLRPLRSNHDAQFATRVAMFELERLIDQGMTEAQFEATRAYLGKMISLLTAGQGTQLGYAMDSHYYGIPPFVEYVREGLSGLTLEAVNAAIKEHLQVDDMVFVYVTKDAEGLRQRLETDRPSPMEYNSPKPEALLAEDKLIEDYPLGFETVEVVPVANYFD